MPFDANGCVSTLMNVDWIKWTDFCVNEFKVGVNDSIVSGNEQLKVENISNILQTCAALISASFRLSFWFPHKIRMN